MSNDRLPATALKSDWGEAARRAAQPQGELDQTGRQATMRRTVGVYERPAAWRAKLSLPLLVIMILVTLISLVLSLRFLF